MFGDIGIAILRHAMIILAGVIMGIALAVVLAYGRRYLALDKPKDRLLPRHVIEIALSYCMLAGAASFEVRELLEADPDEALTWRMFVYLPALLVGLDALRCVYLHLRARGPKIDLLHEIEKEQEVSGQSRRRIDRLIDSDYDDIGGQ